MTAEFEDPLAALRALRTTGDDADAEASTEKKETAESGAGPLSPSGSERHDVTISGATMVGQYAQRTLRLPPSYLALMRQIAENEGTSIAEAERWIVARGLQAYYGDDERPQFESRSGGRLILPWQEKEM